MTKEDKLTANEWLIKEINREIVRELFKDWEKVPGGWLDKDGKFIKEQSTILKYENKN